MASVFDYLAQGMPSETDYLGSNPFYNAGRGISQIQVQPRTSAEAVWQPMLQGLLSGGLAGYGQRQARQSQFADTAANPFIKSQLSSPDALESNPGLAAYLSESAPESWSPKQAKTDVMTSLLMAQNVQDAAAKKAELEAALQAKIKEATNPEILAAKVKQESDIAAAKEKAKVDNTPVKPVVIPSADEAKIAASSAAVNEMRQLASDVENKSWAELQLAKNFSSADKDGIGLRITNLTDTLGKARSGASLNKTEEVAYNKMIAGDFTADPKTMAALLRKLADTESKMSLDKIDFYGGGDNYKSKFSIGNTAPIVTKTLKDGSTVRVRSIGGGQYEKVE